ncbi:Csu type fimbrial protein [Marinivivus vitaminiproducens]|uniref:Csu type fimbrial protein n=1 Tax=Marinivivus vitaminiproducens TaxID=3035935 RepID=UPI0027A15C14|nr:spore coat U domain-containing protein [Geminicoccaceae bacterium SCSIO 64248]
MPASGPRLLTLASLAVLCAAGADEASAQASPITATMTVTASVIESPCSLTGATIAFGQYISGQSSPKRTSSDLTVNCTQAVELRFDEGLNASSTTRQMKGPSASKPLKYDLYINGPDAVQAGGMPGGFGIARNVAGSATPTKVTINGTIFSEQVVPVGNYTDTVTVQMIVQ